MRRLLAAVLLLAAVSASAIEYTPLIGLQVLGGQSFYAGQKSGLAGNVNGTFAPAMRFNDGWELLPALNTAYSGTEQVIDVVGGQTLFQSQWDNLASVKGVYTPADGSPWRLKPSVLFKYELLQETKDEQLGQGLFDYYQYGTGFEAEYLYRDPFSLHASLDYFGTHFPDYTSLESQAATSVAGQSLARELVGDYVLDGQNALARLGASAPLKERFVLEGEARVLYQHFPNQHVVDAEDQLTGPLREDLTTTLAAALRMPADFNADLRVVGALELSGSYDSSNQNSFDAIQVQYLPYFYNYGELRVAPSVKAFIGDAREPVAATLSAAWWRRRYPYRPVQDSNGTYLGEHVRTDNWMLGADLKYPMAKRFSLVFDLQYGQGTSNQHYEQYFKYNYSVTNYWFGFSYQY